jgi:hypothetical protein
MVTREQHIILVLTLLDQLSQYQHHLRFREQGILLAPRLLRQPGAHASFVNNGSLLNATQIEVADSDTREIQSWKFDGPY